MNGSLTRARVSIQQFDGSIYPQINRSRCNTKICCPSLMLDSSNDKSSGGLARVRPCTDWGAHSSRAVRIPNAVHYKSSSENSSTLGRLIRVIFLASSLP